MANYSLIVDSTFQPFSFERYLQPYQMYGEEYRAQEEALGELATQSGYLESLSESPTEQYAYNIYKKYSDDLRAQSDLLASKGLSASSRRDLLNMKARYTKEITPIENAYTRREELIRQQSEALLKDSSLIFDTDYKTVSLETLMKNPQASFSALSGNDIAARVADMAKQVAQSIISDPEFTSVFNGQYVQQKLSKGYTLDQIISAAQRDKNAPRELLGIIDTVKNQVNYDSWSNQNKAKIDSYINEGLNYAIQTSNTDIIANRAYMSDLDKERAELQNDLLEEELKAARGEETPGGGRIVKLGGGKFIEYDKDGNVVRSNAITQTPEEKLAQAEAQAQREALAEVTTVSDMKNKGFYPVGVVLKKNGEWLSGTESEPIPGFPDWSAKSNLKSSGSIIPGKVFSYTPDDPKAEASVVTNLETIPGALEFLQNPDSVGDTPFGQLLHQARILGITDEEFFSDNVQILKVKAKGRKRLSSLEPYDYIIYRKS